LETDFIVKQGSDIKEIIQVAYDLEREDTRKREINGIVECAKELNINKGTIITNTVAETQTIQNIKITFIPLMQWLLQTKR
jgi:predicted AAA+ superfamily ATPase